MQKVFGRLKNWLIPHEGNDHRPHLLRPRAVGFALILLLVVQAIFVFGASQLVPRSRLFGIIESNALISETNENRTTDHLATLTENPLLDAAAQEKANDMVANDYFAHTSPAGLSPWYWFQNVGYNFSYAGENLAVNFSDSSDVTNAWMNSPEHRANILDGNFTEIGMATAQGEFDGAPATYVVELFGTPQAPFSIAAAEAAVGGGAGIATAADMSGSALPGTAESAPAASAPTAPAKKPAIIAVNDMSAKSAPATAPASVPTSAETSSGIASSSAAAQAVQGAQSAEVAPSVPVAHAAEITAANPITQAAADPRRATDALYLIIAGIFIIALVLNTFIKIRIQHPQVIMGGVAVLAAIALLIFFNQHIALTGAAIL